MRSAQRARAEKEQELDQAFSAPPQWWQSAQAQQRSAQLALWAQQAFSKDELENLALSLPPPTATWGYGEDLYDLSFGADPLQTLDLHKTTAAADGLPPVPCVMYVHGGGWAGGDKNTTKNPPLWIWVLRLRGYHVATTNYRLVPDDRHPAQIDDVERYAPLRLSACCTSLSLSNQTPHMRP